ncbi:MAG TPA: hypothetical protein VF388_06150 [Lacunisphaera sp.]
MKTLPLPIESSPSAVSASVDVWCVTVRAEDEPLLLARILQKFTIPEIAVQTAHYEAVRPSGDARVELQIRAQPDRARLAPIRMRKLICVREAELRPAGDL